eukprot:TRINITY_DN22393_c0_g1_i1.p1 TRINITY_DN22393_c0_g1~~TRINITY_DN22393_c0_g1_i1.p1  ORF type:complete len:229 (-),score=44.23 TRINITY_DN22393_c0_g1_i1:141-752(-)
MAVAAVAVVGSALAPSELPAAGPKFGHGREESLDGAVYEGEFSHGKRHGHGVLRNHDGSDRYEGQFRGDHAEGLGSRSWADGTTYAGQWLRGRKHGEGTLTEPEGRTYSGQWADGKRHGRGTQRFADGTSYEGRWDNGQQHGSGRLHKETSTFEGQWVRGSRHGNCLLRASGGVRERQVYNFGSLLAQEDMPPPAEKMHARTK